MTGGTPYGRARDQGVAGLPSRPSGLKSVFRTQRGLPERCQPAQVGERIDAKRIEPWSQKDVVLVGMKRSEVFFAAVILQKAYVSFHSKLVYTRPEMKKVLAPELGKLLMGKPSVRARMLDARLVTQIKTAQAGGFRQYKENG